jgi:hypothetical protein
MPNTEFVITPQKIDDIVSAYNTQGRRGNLDVYKMSFIRQNII